MNIGLFHITDIHAEAGCAVISERFKQLTEYALGAAAKLDQIVWAITGDVSNTGHRAQINHFLEKFEAMKIEVAKRHATVKQLTFAVPGNHDVNLSDESPLRPTVVNAIKSGIERNITPEHIRACVVAQREFADAFSKSGAYHCGDGLLKHITENFGSKSVSFVLVNTAWISEKSEKYGALHLPADVIQTIAAGFLSDLTVILLHHPVNWFDDATQRPLREALESAETICLFGHEHEPSARMIQPFNVQGEMPTLMLDGGVLQQKGMPAHSSFNFLEINLAEGRIVVNKVALTSGAYANVETVQRDIKGKQYSLRKRTKIRQRTLDWAEQHELQLFKGAGSNPTLRDLYVSPEVDDVEETRASRGFESIVRSKQVLNGAICPLLFVGSEKTGKTALLKTYFSALWDAGKIPVYIGGQGISKTSREHISRIIEKAYKEQYEVDKSASWFSLSEECQVLLVDDIDQARIQDTLFPDLFATILDLAPRVVMSSTDMFNLEGPSFQALADSPKRPRLYRLRQFGHELRDDLVLAWLRLDRPFDITDEELLPEVEALRKRLDSILCDDVVPKTPFFLLTILQSISETPNADLSKSALGYYYEFLLTNGLIKAEVPSDQLTKYHSFFTELAFLLLSKGRTNLTETELRVFFHRLVDEYELRLGWEQMIKVGRNARVLGTRDDVFCFYYSYQFLFYAGKALAKRVDNGSGIELFRHLLARSYNIDIANIILFVAHHTRHQLVIDELLSVCESLFESVQPLQFDGDVDKINQLVSDAPKLYVSSKSIRETRKEKLKGMDRAEEEEAPDSERLILLERREIQLTLDFEGQKTLSNVTGIERVNVAMKFVQIVGQALRNHHSEIPKAQKTKIIKTGTLLALRTARHIISDIADNFVSFIPQFSANLDPTQRMEFHTKFGRAVFSFLGMMSCVFVKAIAGSFGYAELTDTYNRVFGEEIWIPTESNGPNSTPVDSLAVSKGIIRIAIRLEDGEPLPFRDIQELRRLIQGNMLAEYVLRYLILDHIYMFPISTQDKQRVYALLGVEVKTQQAIEMLGKIGNR